MKTVKTELVQPIEHLFISEEFEKMCRLNGFESLKDIVAYPVSDLLNKPGFTMRLLKELIKILESYHLEDVLKD
jgi:hypothetical protein